MRGLREGDRFGEDPGSKAIPSKTIQTGRRTMSQKKKLTTNAGAPVVDNQNTMTAGSRGPDYSLFNESHNERSKYHE
jgi:hypothetical protein